MGERIIKGHVGIGPKVTGEALVASDNFSARYDLNRVEGVFSRSTHKLVGQNYVGKVLVLNAAKGGVATAWMLREMAAREMVPIALLLKARRCPFPITRISTAPAAVFSVSALCKCWSRTC